MNQYLRQLFVFLALWGVGLACHVRADSGGHFNRAELRQESASTIAVTFHLNWPQALHQLLAPQIPFKDFLITYLELPDPELGKAVSKMENILAKTAYLTLPSGARVSFKKWQFPSSMSLRKSLRLTLMLIDKPTNIRAHIDPVKVMAEAKSKNAMSQVQIKFPTAFFPILVSLKNDKFWLTEHIPLAVISF